MAELKSDSDGSNITEVAATPSRGQFLDREKHPSPIAEAQGEQPNVSQLSAAPIEADYGRIATEYEVEHLLHVVDDIPFHTWVACIATVCERFVWYGATAPLQNYLQHPPGGEVPGALGLGQSIASNIVNALMISSYITPIPAAVVADSFGRYRTMLWSAVIEAIGATVLFGTSLPGALRIGAGLPGMVVAIVFLSIGSGAFKTTAVPFIADQYEETEFRVKTLKSGEKVVTSRELTITYIYNAFYWGENIGGFIADCTPLVERYVGFWVAYLVPCCVMWLTLVPILLGRSKFVRTTPEADVIPQAAAALWCGIKDGFEMDAAKPSAQLAQHRRVVPWSETFIEDIKISLLTLLFPIFWLCFNQTFNNLISQAGQMITYGIPNDMMKVTGAIAGIVVAPIVQKGLYPFLTRHRVHFRPIARMTVGFGILSLAMAYTAVIQHLIYNTGPCYDYPLACPASYSKIPNQISVFLQIPIYFAGELAQIFCCTTGTEYAYNRAPKSMKSLVQAIWYAMGGIGSCLALAFSPLAEDPRLVIMYSLLAGLLGICTVLLWLLFGHLDKKATMML
ncbi:major facilitator superfamily domain-containing protein [Xylariaceae sp. FL0662B]|nr:major facilitator superfamily domain-containing protein [Xylariaceae sp. FL0662B]